MARGFDKYELQQGLELDLQMLEGTGTETKDWSKNALHDPTLTGPPTWVQNGTGLNMLALSSLNPDFIEIAGIESTELDFTVEDFTLSIWVYLETSLDVTLMCRGLQDTDGWFLTVAGPAGRVYFTTNQAAASQVSYSYPQINLEYWQNIVITRSDNEVYIYINGRDRTEFKDNHVNPTTSARKLLVGVYDDETTNPINGRIWRPRAWVRGLNHEGVKAMFDSEKHYFGVV